MVVLYLRAVYLFLTALAIIDTVYTMCGFSQMVACFQIFSTLRARAYLDIVALHPRSRHAYFSCIASHKYDARSA